MPKIRRGSRKTTRQRCMRWRKTLLAQPLPESPKHRYVCVRASRSRREARQAELEGLPHEMWAGENGRSCRGKQQHHGYAAVHAQFIELLQTFFAEPQYTPILIDLRRRHEQGPSHRAEPGHPRGWALKACTLLESKQAPSRLCRYRTFKEASRLAVAMFPSTFDAILFF
jgi:hypothetical protein